MYCNHYTSSSLLEYRGGGVFRHQDFGRGAFRMIALSRHQPTPVPLLLSDTPPLSRHPPSLTPQPTPSPPQYDHHQTPPDPLLAPGRLPCHRLHRMVLALLPHRHLPPRPKDQDPCPRWVILHLLSFCPSSVYAVLIWTLE